MNVIGPAIGILMGIAVVVVIFSYAPQRPDRIKCTQWRELSSGVFSDKSRCEKWADGKTRSDVYPKN